MKKILSTVLALTMILSLVAAMGLSVSAKDGDVLYKVNFKGDDKYAPGTFSCLVENCLDYVVSDDGTSATVTYKSDVSKGRAFWGGTVQGLTYGEGKQYTIAMKMAIGTYINDSGVLSSGNAGVFINMPVNTDPTYLLDLGYKSLVGYYGCPNIRHIMSYGAGGKATGKMISSNVGYFTTNLSTVDAEGFVDIAFVVDGKNVKVFINNVYIDEFDAFNAGMVTAAGNVGISAYLYNPGASITMKDVVIYEGNTVTNPTYPDYYVEGAAVTTYDSTKTGDLLFSADFSRNDGGFNPRFLAGNGGKIAVTTDPANKNYIKFEQDGTKAAGTYYGAVVEGLEVNSETRYTTEWKVKTGAQNSGFCFAVPTLFPFSYSYNIYGNFQTGSFATEYGSTKITNINTPGEEYVPVSDLANDADGYATFRVEMHGYTATIYYLNTEGKWISYNVIDMNNTTKAKDTATAYIHETGFQLCVGFYLHNKGLVAEYKDINVYKGLLISDPEGKLDPVITEPEVPAEPVPTGDAAWIYVLVAAVALLGTAFVAKRREN